MPHVTAQADGSSHSRPFIPPPQRTSTPKKKTNGVKVNGIYGSPQEQNGSVQKKRKMVHLGDSDEEIGSKLFVNGSSAKGVLAPRANGISHKQENGSNARSSIEEQRKQLPIAKGREVIIREIQSNDTVILLGETGSGKTTQVPQYILESGMAKNGVIAITQPRRVAATSLAARVSQEQNDTLGKLVGYSVRFDECCSPSTRIKFVTDGMLVREMHSDRLLSNYSVIIIDEAHERTLNTDVLMASLKGIQRERNRSGETNGKGKGKSIEGRPLKIVIMSATLDAEKFSKFYNGAKILYVKGRQHPVTIYHTSVSQPDYVDSALRTLFQIHLDQPPGDVLIFLPGQEDIEGLEKAIKLYADQLPEGQMRILTCPLFAALPQHQQSKVFHPTPKGTRKCILATNIAETSITIPGVKYVIDSGKCKEKRHIARQTGSGIDTLLTQDISKSSAMQRAGRAGREGKGYCFRLYRESDFESLPSTSIPEIQRCSLTSCMLQLKCLGQDLDTLEILDRPDVEAIASALKTLYILGAFDEKRQLTSIGREMNRFPLDPSFARSLLASKEYGCSNEILDIISVLSSSSKLFFDTSDQRDEALEARSKFRHPTGDHMTTLNAFRAYQEIAGAETKAGRKDWCRRQFLNERTLVEATNIRDQLRKICDKANLDWRVSSEDSVPVLKSLIWGMAQRTALIRAEGGYKQIMGPSIIKVHPTSTLRDRKVPVIMYDELVFTGSSYARGVSAVPPSLLSEIPIFTVGRRLANNSS